MYQNIISYWQSKMSQISVFIMTIYVCVQKCNRIQIQKKSVIRNTIGGQVIMEPATKNNEWKRRKKIRRKKRKHILKNKKNDKREYGTRKNNTYLELNSYDYEILKNDLIPKNMKISRCQKKRINEDNIVEYYGDEFHSALYNMIKFYKNRYHENCKYVEW